MKGLLYFLGSIIRWPVQQPSKFAYFHLYLVGIYILTYLTRSVGLNISGLFFTSGMIAPIAYLIGQGLPLDCLDYKSAIKREFQV